MTVSLTAKKLTIEDAKQLGPRIRPSDRRDLHRHGTDPEKSIRAGIFGGEAWGVWDGDTLIGCGGWTFEGAIWTLFAELSLGQAKALLRIIPAWARIIAIRSKRPLQNVFVTDNKETRAFLVATGCIDFLEHHLFYEGRGYQPFFLKPLEDLPHV